MKGPKACDTEHTQNLDALPREPTGSSKCRAYPQDSAAIRRCPQGSGARPSHSREMGRDYSERNLPTHGTVASGRNALNADTHLVPRPQRAHGLVIHYWLAVALHLDHRGGLVGSLKGQSGQAQGEFVLG